LFPLCSIHHGQSIKQTWILGRRIRLRVPLANVLIFQAIETLQMRIINDNNERQLFLNNTANAQLLASRYKDKDTVAHRRIGYCIPISLKERQDYEYEQEQKAKKENKLG